MIVIVEGINGSGKSTLVESLIKNLWRGQWAVYYRPFLTGRWNDEWVKFMREQVKIPVNTYIEDLFVDDALAVAARAGAGSNIIRDRSLPSAIAYGIFYGIISSDHPINGWMELWQKSLLQAGEGQALYIQLRCSYGDSKERCNHKNFPFKNKDEWLEVAGWIDWCWQRITIPKLCIDTNGYAPGTTAVIAREFIDEHQTGSDQAIISGFKRAGPQAGSGT